jgi:hypothetical protein
MKSFKELFLVSIVAVLGASLALAHGDAVAQRGGILQVMGELDFELVVKADKIDLYTSDDEQPVPSEQMSGMLTIMSDAGSSKVELVAAGINRLRATDATAESGSRVVAIVTMPDGKSLAVQFAIP